MILEVIGRAVWQILKTKITCINWDTKHILFTCDGETANHGELELLHLEQIQPNVHLDTLTELFQLEVDEGVEYGQQGERENAEKNPVQYNNIHCNNQYFIHL